MDVSLIGTPERIESIGYVAYVEGGEGRVPIPTYDDIKAIDVTLLVNVKTVGSAGDDTVWSSAMLVKTLEIEGDGHKNIVKCRGYHLPSIHKQFYNSPCPIPAPAGTAIYKVNARIPVGVFRHQYRDVVAKVTFGLVADINVNGSFALNPSAIKIAAVYGKVSEGYRIHYDEQTGTVLTFRCPARGILAGEAIVNVDGTDDTEMAIQVEHEGQNTIDTTWDALTSAESTQTQQAHLDGQLNLVHNLLTVKDNTYIYLDSAVGSKTVDVVYFYVEQVKPQTVSKNGTVTEGPITSLTTAEGRVSAFGVTGAKQIAAGTVPRGTTYSLLGKSAFTVKS
jgi:hypothetical protein